MAYSSFKNQEPILHSKSLLHTTTSQKIIYKQHQHVTRQPKKSKIPTINWRKHKHYLRDPLEKIIKSFPEDEYDYNVHYELEKVKYTNFCFNKNPTGIFPGNLIKILEYVKIYVFFF